jgi:anti-anti-sigma regulatory factor
MLESKPQPDPAVTRIDLAYPPENESILAILRHDLLQRTADAIAEGAAIRIDARAVTYVDSALLELLDALAYVARTAGISLAISDAPPRLQRAFCAWGILWPQLGVRLPAQQKARKNASIN